MEEYKIKTIREDGEIRTEVHLGETPLNPETLVPPYDSIIKTHEKIIRNANIENITTTFSF